MDAYTPKDRNERMEARDGVFVFIFVFIFIYLTASSYAEVSGMPGSVYMEETPLIVGKQVMFSGNG